MPSASQHRLERRALDPSGSGLGRTTFSRLYREYFGFVWSSLRRLGVPHSAIDDAAQDLWITVHRRLDQLSPEASEKAWLFGVARRVASHYRRREFRNKRKLAAYSVAPLKANEQPMKGRDAAMFVETFLARLEERKRVAFVLSELEGWSAPEIARVAGTNPNTIYSRIRLAREQLRAQIEQSQLEIEAEEALEHTKQATQAPDGAAKRCWVGLLPKLATIHVAAPLAPAALSFANLKLVALGAAIGAVTLVTADMALGDPPEPAAEVTEARPKGEPEAQRRSPAKKTNKEAVQAATTAPAPPPVQSPTPQVPKAKPAKAPPRNATLEAETVVLSEARSLLGTGNAQGALAKLGEHRTRFPRGALSDLRTVLEVQALCAAGNRPQAQQLANQFVKSHPGTAAAEKLRDACPKP